MVDATIHPLSGLWKPNTVLKGLFYGPGVVRQHLISTLPSPTSSKAFIVTGSSLATKTPLVQQVEALLGGQRHAGTFSSIGEHAPVAQLDQATALVQADPSIDTIIAIGGGSPIDSAKVISFRVHEKTGKFLHHVVIPTTLSAAECTSGAGYTRADGVKTGIGAHEGVLASYILYDADFARYTPPELFASTGIRALDHAVELQYHPTASLVARRNGLLAIQDLFELLPRYRAEHAKGGGGGGGGGGGAAAAAGAVDDDTFTRLFLAAYASLGFLGLNTRGGLGLSHTLGYALGSPYGIPHGRTSCLTLGNVVKLKAAASKDDAASIARILPFIGETPSGDVVADATRVGDRINKLVADLGFQSTLTARGVAKDQVDIIVARATGGLKASDDLTEEQKKLHAAVKQLVENLY
ncbi:hypothetical protein DV735_g4870, partial [Chaetothyriales sp. CBS 134920]